MSPVPRAEMLRILSHPHEVPSDVTVAEDDAPRSSICRCDGRDTCGTCLYDIARSSGSRMAGG